MMMFIIIWMGLEPQNRPQSVQEWLDLLIPKPVAAETTRVISAVGMDYINLRNLLAAKKWKEADEETRRVMLKVAGREEGGWLDRKSIDKFPCEDLRTIDQLWVKYSNGRFGFSVQERIYQSLGGVLLSFWVISFTVVSELFNRRGHRGRRGREDKVEILTGLKPR